MVVKEETRASRISGEEGRDDTVLGVLNIEGVEGAITCVGWYSVNSIYHICGLMLVSFTAT